MRSSLTSVFAVGVMFILGCPVWAENDSLIRAVRFALTGTAGADPKVIGDPANCIFVINNKTFHLNNVYTDRIKIQKLQDQQFGNLRQGVIVELQGGEIVFEITVVPPNDDGSELMRQMRAESPDMFNPHHYTYTRQELRLSTNNEDEVKRAWQYIYSHGCTGKRAP